MAKLYFKVGSDWEEVVRLRNEIVKLKQELMSMDGTQSPAAFKALNVQLAASNQRLDELVTNAAKAGAEMETGFKKGIYDGEKAVNSLSEEIIKQKDIIRETQNDVSMLTEQYKKLGKYDPKRQSLSDELNRAKAAPLCIYDYQFPANEDEFQDILIIRNRLMEYMSEGSAERKAILSILLQKCHFIIRKIKKTPFYYNIESAVELIFPMEMNIGSYDEFVKEECNSASKAEELLADINGINPNLKSFVLLMKYYKQNFTDKSDIDKMWFVLNQFSNIYQIRRDTQAFISPANSVEEYNKFSLNSIFNFLHNCCFSFYIQKCEPNLRQIKEKLLHIEHIQAKTGVKNFHPYEKAIEAIIRCIELHIGKDDFDNRLIEDKLEELNRVILLYKEAYDWSSSHQFFPFQLPFEESMCSVGDGSIRLFMPSAYARYINYNTLKERLEQFNRTKEYLRFRCDLSMERKEITQIKEDIKASDKKAYDSIAIFIAAITFLFGIVNIFINNTTLNLYQLITNTIGLGILLLLFAFSYLFVSPLLVQRISWTHYRKTGRFIVGIIVIVSYFILICSLCGYSQSAIDKTGRTGTIIDTLHNESKSELQQIKPVQ